MKILNEILKAKKDYKIGLSCSPSRHIGHEIISAKKILMSFGGGMGGANTTFYVKDEEIKYNEHGMAKVVNVFNGDEFEINAKYVVKSNSLKLLIAKSDNTAHANFNKVICKKSEEIRVFELPNNFGKLEFVSEYIPQDKMGLELVRTITNKI